MSVVSNFQAKPDTKWKVLPQVEPSLDLQRLAAERKLHPVIVKLLAQRGYQKLKDIEAFLEPRLADLPPPLAMKGMKEASAIAGQAIINMTPILIWGDYDVDGATGTALLISFFQSLGVEAHYIIPNRITHGYGLHHDLLQDLAPGTSESKKLLITVDCGISANEELIAAREMGYQVIVTDHHEPPDGFCAADAVLNPKQSSCDFPTEELAGVGVAFYLACGIRQHLRETGFFNDKRPEPDVRELLDLVALGTIADVVPLRQVNRTLVKEGMRRIEKLGRAGIKAMLAVAGLLDGQRKIIGSIGTEDIGFLLAPMINAAGRLADADLAVQLLLCRDLDSAMPLAQQLLTLNSTRKAIGHDVYTRALAMRPTQGGVGSCYVVKGEFHHGVLGIVASRLVETLGIPTLVFSEEKNDKEQLLLKGSGRSIPGVNLHSALEQCAELLVRYGGHAMAAGMSVAGKDFETFRKKINKEISKQMYQSDIANILTIDLEAEIGEIFSSDCKLQLQLLEPFGPENIRPMFIAKKSRIIEMKSVGTDNRHLKVTFESIGRFTKGIAFNMGPHLHNGHRHENLEIAYSHMVNRYRDTPTWEARVTGIRCQQERGEIAR
jgi:single-stranded-DNA-specific exonuclease